MVLRMVSAFLLCLLMMGCTTAVPSTPMLEPAEVVVAVTETAVSSTATPIPTPLNTAVPTPIYSTSDDDVIAVELGEPFALIWEQSAQLVGTNFRMDYYVEIEFECGTNEDCEVPLITTGRLDLFQGDEQIGWEPVEREIVSEPYLITLLRDYEGYDYDEHQFETVWIIHEPLKVEATREAHQENDASGSVWGQCQDGLFEMRAVQPSVPELYMMVVQQGDLQDEVEVVLERVDQPIVIALSATESVVWQLDIADGVQLEQVVLLGPTQQTAVGVDSELVLDLSNNGARYDILYNWKASSAAHETGFGHRWVYDVEEMTASKLTTFARCDRSFKFIIEN